jgi:lysyl-tRNA synthetase class 2
MTQDLLWRPSASAEALRARAQLYQHIRQFFYDREVLEVETPLLCQHGVTDPHIDSFICNQRYLQTSPEYAMKRLLANGSGAIFQICKAFRQEEAGSQHNPEFSMLEWYRPGFNHHDLMNEVDTLLQTILPYRTAKKQSYRDCFLEHTGIDPHHCSADTLRQYAKKVGIDIHQSEQINDKDTWLQYILADQIEPQLGQSGAYFLYDFPASQAALAQLSHSKPPVAERFEVYYHGIELANGFHELRAAEEQAKRFQANNQQRRSLAKAEPALDPYFLAALEAGLPACAGIALGLDRLLMLQLGTKRIDEVLAFTWSNA